MQASPISYLYMFQAHWPAVQIVELEPAAVSVQGLYTDKRSKIITIPDVFHQLHCLVSGFIHSDQYATHHCQKQIRLALADVDYRTSNDAKRHIHVGKMPTHVFVVREELITYCRSLRRLPEAGHSVQRRHDAAETILQRLSTAIDDRLRWPSHVQGL